ncbi:hypothetical protein ACFFRR_003061 [Megaselia abdita]
MFSQPIKINHTLYTVTKKVLYPEAHPPKMVSLKFLEHEHKISLPYLHKLNIDNTNIIQSISEDIDTHKTIWWTITSVLIAAVLLIVMCSIVRAVCSNRKATSDITPGQMEQIIKHLRSETSQT